MLMGGFVVGGGIRWVWMGMGMGMGIGMEALFFFVRGGLVVGGLECVEWNF